MTWQNQSGDGGKNPWGRGPGAKDDKPGERPRNPWGTGGGRTGGPGNGSGGNEPPNPLDDMLRRAQAHMRPFMPGHMNGGTLIALFAAGIVALWLISGFYIINPGENGVIQRFGKLERTQTASGLGYHFPWPVETIETINVSQMRRMPIGFSEQGGPAQSSQASATRDVPEESLMLTSDANIVDLDLVVLWNIKSAQSYLFNIDDPENTIKKVAESAIREVVGQTPMLPIITNARAQVADQARKIMQQNLDGYHSGINIAQVLIQQAEVHPDVQEAFQDVQSAKQDAINVQNLAETYRQDILPKARGRAIQTLRNAEGYRDAVVARATGEAKRFNAVYESYQLGKDVTRTRLYLETMENVLSHAQTTVIDSKAGGVVPYLSPIGAAAAPPPAPPAPLTALADKPAAATVGVKP